MSAEPAPEKRQRKPRQHSSLRSSSNDKKIKIKITAARDANRDHSGSEDELEPDVAIEEQFILRMPPGDACNKLRDMVRKRDVTDDVKFVFKGTPAFWVLAISTNIITNAFHIDPRHGHFYIDGQQFDTKLVDLPTIIESQKTIDQKQLYKIADISQVRYIGIDSRFSFFFSLYPSLTHASSH